MAKNRNDQLEDDTINRISNLLEDNYLNNLINDTEALDNDVVEGDDIPEEEDQKTFPGLIHISMEPMKMIATLELKKPINSENEITFEKIKETIEKHGNFLTSQVDWNLVHELFERVIIDDELVGPQIIAHGKKVQAYIPEHIKLQEKLIINNNPEIDEKGRANYHKTHSLKFVTQDEYLGDIIKSVSGKSGKKLDGTDIPYPTMNINNYVPDQNIYTQEDKIFSKIDGTFKILENKLIVAPCLDIPSDLDYHTGDIDFNGDIVVEGNVRSGFKLFSGGDIHIRETIEPTNIKAKRNLVVDNGIFGSKDYKIDINGELKTKHLENVNLFVDKNAEIQNSIIHSNMFCNGKIKMGKKGSIVGGLTYALNGIECTDIGNLNGTITEINLGVDFRIMHKLEEIKIVSDTITKEMEILQDKIKNLKLRPERDKAKYLFLSLKNRLNSLNNHTRRFLRSLDKNDRAKLTVTGTIYPGTIINICHIKKTIKEPLKKVTLFLNKDYGRIDFTGEPLP